MKNEKKKTHTHTHTSAGFVVASRNYLEEKLIRYSVVLHWSSFTKKTRVK